MTGSQQKLVIWITGSHEPLELKTNTHDIQRFVKEYTVWQSGRQNLFFNLQIGLRHWMIRFDMVQVFYYEDLP